jgi:hypothetical protein
MKANPAGVVPNAALRCPECGAGLVRAETGWACPAGLTHVRILSDAQAADRVRLPLERPSSMSPHQWGWYRTRPTQWAARIVREIRKVYRRS